MRETKVKDRTSSDTDNLDNLRPVVETLGVQATALLNDGRRSDIARMPLKSTENIFSLDHAADVLGVALNSIMRSLQGFKYTLPKEQRAALTIEIFATYALWFQQWEEAFTIFLAERRHAMSNLDLKRAMVLKANHILGTMLASIDPDKAPEAYEVYGAEFRAIVSLSREVLSDFPAPPLATMGGGNAGTPYLSLSFWITAPLWQVISRCREPSLRQAAFDLLSRYPRQEGLWHAGPEVINNRFMRRVEAGHSILRETVKSESMPGDRGSHGRNPASNHSSSRDESREADSGVTSTNDDSGGAPEEMDKPQGSLKVRAEWVDMKAQITPRTDDRPKSTTTTGRRTD